MTPDAETPEEIAAAIATYADKQGIDLDQNELALFAATLDDDELANLRPEYDPDMLRRNAEWKERNEGLVSMHDL